MAARKSRAMFNLLNVYYWTSMLFEIKIANFNAKTTLFCASVDIFEVYTRFVIANPNKPEPAQVGAISKAQK